MKNNLPTYTLGLTALGLLMQIPSAHALSFVQGTIFLEAQTESECTTLGGNFTEWYNETYCTKNPEVSRAEFLQTVLESRQNTSLQCRRAFNYPDVDWSADYADALQVASCMNIVSGNPDGTFKPEQGITYAEAAKIITLAFELPMTREMHPTWYGGYIQTLNRLEAAPREDIEPGDTLTPMEMNHIVNTLNKNMTNSADYIGLTVEEAQSLAAENNTIFRVLSLDGQPLPMTLDYRPGRINASVENNIVVDYTIEGEEETNESTVDYLGLTLEEGQLLASQNDTPFRVVMLDGQMQPTTRDFRVGRINATIENNLIVDYYVEGEEKNETPAMPSDYIGLSVEAAQALAEQNGVPFRVTMQDGQPLPATMDFRIGRINAAVEDDIVVDYSVEGVTENEETKAERCDEHGNRYKSDEEALQAGLSYAEFGATYCEEYTSAKALSNIEKFGADETPQSEIITIKVAAQKRECMGVGPMECLVVDGNNWYSDIEGFEFEAGFEYELKIEKNPRPEPIPADANAFTYKLIEVLAKTPTE